jgi:hypothetical protein
MIKIYNFLVLTISIAKYVYISVYQSVTQPRIFISTEIMWDVLIQHIISVKD